MRNIIHCTRLLSIHSNQRRRIPSSITITTTSTTYVRHSSHAAFPLHLKGNKSGWGSVGSKTLRTITNEVNLPEAGAVSVTDENKPIPLDNSDTEEIYFSQERKPWLIGAKSPMYKSLLNPRRYEFMKSRRGISTWSMIHREHLVVAESIAKSSRYMEYVASEGVYRTVHTTTNALANHLHMITPPVSVYTGRRLRPAGIACYESFLTEEEERKILAEVLGHRMNVKGGNASYIPEDGRFCSNVFETPLHLYKGNARNSSAREHPIVSGISSFPVLHECAQRAFRLGHIPMMPNTYQINEYVTQDAGYDAHRKHPNLGPYIAILTLVSADILILQHHEEIWRPKIYLAPRSLVVLSDSARYDYLFEISKARQVFRSRDATTQMNFTRHTKDYRVEIVFASVDVRQHSSMGILQNMQHYKASLQQKKEGIHKAEESEHLQRINRLPSL